MQKFYLKTACIISLILLCLFGFSAKIYAQTEWDLLYTTNLSRIMSPSIDPDAYGIFYYNGNIYVSSATVYYPHSQYNEKGKLFKLKQTGDVWSLDESIVIPDISVGNMNFTGFTTVGDYLYGVNRSNTIYKIKLSTMIVEEKITTTLGQCIAIAFDPVRDAFWITDNNANSKVVLVNKNGTIVADEVLWSKNGNTNVSICGLAYDNVTEGGPYLLASCGNFAAANIGIISRWKLADKEYEYAIKDVQTLPGSASSGNFMGSIYLYEDAALGKVILAGISKPRNLMFGYDFATLAAPAAPNKVSNLTATPGTSGALNVKLSWTNPTKKVNGEALTQLTSVKVYRGETLVHTLQSPSIGNTSTWTDNSPSQGNVEYKVIPVNSAGEGIASSVKTFVGVDVPAAVTNLVLTKNGMTGRLTWTAPATGVNNGWINTSSTRYKIVRQPDNIELEANFNGNSYTDNTITELKNYSYTIVSINEKGEGGSIISNSLVIGPALLPTWSENFDDANNYALWTIINANNDGVTWERSTNSGYSTPSCAKYGYDRDNAGDDWLISPPFSLQAGKTYRLKWSDRTQSPNFEEKYKVKMGNMPTPAGQSTELADYAFKLTSYTERSVVLPVLMTSGEYYFSWYCYSDANGSGMFIDDIVLEELFATDMEAISLTGEKNQSVGVPTVHTITVRNNGTTGASNFSVKLVDGSNTVLGTTNYNGTLASGKTADIEINWTPVIDGSYSIKGIVEIPGDANPKNDVVSFDVVVRAFGTFEIQVGKEEVFNSSVPFYFQFQHSISQTLYFEDEINKTGRIDYINYYNNFSNAISEREIQIYMALTDNSEFTDKKWITSATLVFDGKVSFPKGKNVIPIKLDFPFHYTGGNLMVMCVAPTGDAVSNAGFLTSTSEHPNRTLYRFTVGSSIFDIGADGKTFEFQLADGIQINPTSNFPNISFVINTEVGILKGKVSDGINPLTNATVSIEGTNFDAKTDANGEYIIYGIPVGNYTVKALKEGYSESSQVIQITKGAEKTANFVVNSLTQIKVSGTVKNSANQPVKNAAIILLGNSTYKTVTDAEGKFSIDEVFGSQKYRIYIKAGGYISMDEEVIATESDLILNAYTLVSCTSNSARELKVEGGTPEWYDITLTWKEPIAPSNGETLQGYNIYANGILINDLIINSLSYIYTVPEGGTYLMEVAAVWSTGCEAMRISKSVVIETNPCDIAIASFPYTEGFEAEEIPSCWIQDVVFGNTSWSISKTIYKDDPHSGEKYIRLQNTTARGQTKLISPKFDISGLVSPTLHFWHSQPPVYGSSSSDILRVYTKNSVGGEWILLKEFTEVEEEWEEAVFDLPNPTDTYWLAFEGSLQVANGVYLDDISVISDICNPVRNLKATQLLENSVKLTWDVPASLRVKGYKIERDNVVIEENVVDTEFIDQDLNLGLHTYKVTANYEKEYCNASTAKEVSITTVEMCDPVTNFKIVTLDRNTVKLTWDAIKASKFASYTIKRGGTEIITDFTEVTYTDTDLSQGVYEYTILANYKDKECSVSKPVSEKILVKCTRVDEFNIEMAPGRVARLSWKLNVPDYYGELDIAEFVITKDGVEVAKLRENTFNDREIESGKTYTYCIKPFYDNGCEGDEYCKELLVECYSPTNIEADIQKQDDGTYNAKLTWNVSGNKTSNISQKSANHQDIHQWFSLPQQDGNYRKQQSDDPEPSTNIVFDNGPIITHMGQGYDGLDVSVQQEGHAAGAFSVGIMNRIFLADDFELFQETYIAEIDFFAHVSGSTSLESPFIGVWITIWDGDPSLDGRVIFGGDECMLFTGFAGIYRTGFNNLLVNTNPIMGLKNSIHQTLPAGKYWIEMTCHAFGYNVNGPWVTPVTILGEINTGNGLHYINGGWNEMEDSGTGGKLGLPFTIYGDLINTPVNIYRDDQLIASNVTANSYIDEDVTEGKHTWSIETICNDIESGKIHTTQWVSIENSTYSSLSIYPNPVTDKVTVEKGGNINHIQILNTNGLILKDINNIDMWRIDIDMSSFEKGIYIFSIDGQRMKVVKQ